jgi:hypothetical protein
MVQGQKIDGHIYQLGRYWDMEGGRLERMRQTTLSVPLDIKPESSSRLSALIERLKRREDTGAYGIPENYGRVARDIPSLHFMSLSVFPASEFDPIFILEANFDGEPGVFWGQLEAALGSDLRDIVCCCKRPLDEDGPLYDAVTAPDSRAPLAPLFEARTQRPSVYHHGNRGLTRDRILREAKLFSDAGEELDDPTRIGPSPYRGVGAVDVHRSLRQRMLAAHPWLDTPSPQRVTRSERIVDLLRLVAFVVAILFVLCLPGMIVGFSLPKLQYIVVMVAAALVIGGLVYRKREPLPGTEVKTHFSLLKVLLPQLPLIAGLVVAYAVTVSVIFTAILMIGSYLFELTRVGHAVSLWFAFWPTVDIVLWGLLSLIVILPLLVLWLRYLERRDSSHDAPAVNEGLLREMIRREDWIAQNHMGSIVLIKPGVLRMAIIRAGHLGLGLLLRVIATDGYLGSMRTVHFAHWAFLNNSSRLLFFSNFDHSWGSYLDDFIEKAHVGLTLAWGCGVGFPATRFLIYDGASQPWTEVQELGDCLPRRQPVLVLRLSDADCRSDRT